MTLTYPEYSNGRFPLSMLVKLVGSGGDNHYLPPATAARWYALQARAKKRTGKTLTIWPGWDAYRPYAAQVAAKEQARRNGNELAAATPGTSSHGLVFRGRDAAALDAGNWSEVYGGDYNSFFADARSVGFTADYIRPGVNGYPLGTPREFWHLFDFDPWGAIPAFDDVKPFPEEEEEKPQEDNMNIIAGPGGAQKFADEFGADDIGEFFYVPNGPNNTPTWEDNIRAAWFLAGEPKGEDSTSDQWRYDLARHQANARWNKKRGEIVTDVVNALKPLFAAVTPLAKEEIEKLLEEGLKEVVVAPAEVSDADKEEIARRTREIFREDPLG